MQVEMWGLQLLCRLFSHLRALKYNFMLKQPQHSKVEYGFTALLVHVMPCCVYKTKCQPLY